jgi:hypothetical protein
MNAADSRARLENLVEWLRLELSKKDLDAETTYEHATQIVDVVAELRVLNLTSGGHKP